MIADIVSSTAVMVALGLFIISIIRTIAETTHLHETSERWRMFYKNCPWKVILLLLLIAIIAFNIPKNLNRYEPNRLPASSTTPSQAIETKSITSEKPFDYNEFKNEKIDSTYYPTHHDDRLP